MYDDLIIVQSEFVVVLCSFVSSSLSFSYLFHNFYCYILWVFQLFLDFLIKRNYWKNIGNIEEKKFLQ